MIDSELWRHQRDAWYGKMWAPISAVFFKTELQGAQESAEPGTCDSVAFAVSL